MAVKAVIFDWGGTLTPWHTVDHEAQWLGICSRHLPAPEAGVLAGRLWSSEVALWEESAQSQVSYSLEDVLARAGVSVPAGFWDTYFEAWEPHTLTDPQAPELLQGLRASGVKIGVLSNTMWPRSAHEGIFARDGMLELIDGAVYSSEIPWTKPHPDAFRAAMAAVRVDDPGSCVFIGDRPFDDIFGAKRAGMRAVHIANSPVPEYADARPDAVIRTLTELPAHLSSW
jgi:putative hydrolase of the HAD superfamily